MRSFLEIRGASGGELVSKVATQKNTQFQRRARPRVAPREAWRSGEEGPRRQRQALAINPPELKLKLDKSSTAINRRRWGCAAEPGDPFANSYVKPSLTLDEYLDFIASNRQQAFQIMAEDLEAGDFRHLSNSLVVEPFDAVRQALFFIPWVLLQDVGEEVGMRVQLAYLDFKDRLVILDKVALEANRFNAEEEEVLLAVEALNLSIDQFLSVVPGVDVLEKCKPKIS